jgi:AraC-like DNA-binding protein
MDRTDDPAVVKFSTDTLPERERVAAFRDLYARLIIRHDIEPLDASFKFRTRLRRIGAVALACSVSTAIRARRTPEHIDGDDLVMNFSLTGGRLMQQRGREVLVTAGEAIMATSADPGVAVIQDASRFVSLRLPFVTMAPRLGDVDACLIRPLPANRGTMALLLRYLETLDRCDALAVPGADEVVAGHICDLAVLALGATRDAAKMAERGGLRAARLAAAKADILARLSDEALAVGDVAGRLGVTPRYVQMLFEDEGITFSEYVLDRRLACAHARLADAGTADVAISTIAFEAGFSNLSYFNRTFRRRYGMTPSEVREQAQRTRA